MTVRYATRGGDLFYRYIHGDCWLLAQAIADRTNWQIVAFLDQDKLGHVLVQLPDERYLDVRGTLTEDEILSEWSETLEARELGSVHDLQWGQPHLDVTTIRIAEELICRVMTEEVHTNATT